MNCERCFYLKYKKRGIGGEDTCSDCLQRYWREREVLLASIKNRIL